MFNTNTTNVKGDDPILSFSSVISSEIRGKFFLFDAITFNYPYGSNATPSEPIPTGIFLGTIFKVEKEIVSGVEYTKIFYLTVENSKGFSEFCCKNTCEEIMNLINS